MSLMIAHTLSWPTTSGHGQSVLGGHPPRLLTHEFKALGVRWEAEAFSQQLDPQTPKKALALTFSGTNKVGRRSGDMIPLIETAWRYHTVPHSTVTLTYY